MSALSDLGWSIVHTNPNSEGKTIATIKDRKGNPVAQTVKPMTGEEAFARAESYAAQVLAEREARNGSVG